MNVFTQLGLARHRRPNESALTAYLKSIHFKAMSPKNDRVLAFEVGWF